MSPERTEVANVSAVFPPLTTHAAVREEVREQVRSPMMSPSGMVKSSRRVGLRNQRLRDHEVAPRWRSIAHPDTPGTGKRRAHAVIEVAVSASGLPLPGLSSVGPHQTTPGRLPASGCRRWSGCVLLAVGSITPSSSLVTVQRWCKCAADAVTSMPPISSPASVLHVEEYDIQGAAEGGIRDRQTRTPGGSLEMSPYQPPRPGCSVPARHRDQNHQTQDANDLRNIFVSLQSLVVSTRY